MLTAALVVITVSLCVECVSLLVVVVCIFSLVSCSTRWIFTGGTQRHFKTSSRLRNNDNVITHTCLAAANWMNHVL